jgi:pSer/pThr/pTyr-binding forkhead associated (FHA) protein
MLPVGTFIVGRKDVDINLKDKSVSRKHAEISIIYPSDDQNESEEYKRPVLTIKDLGSTFGTYLNSSQNKLEKDVVQILQPGNVVRVGQQYAAFRVCWEPIVVCMSRTSKQEKADLKVWSRKIGAQLVSEWNSQVTHLTTGKVNGS